MIKNYININKIKKKIIIYISFIPLLIISIFLLHKTDKAFIFIFSSWGLYLLLLFYFTKNIVRILSFNFSIIFFILTATEFLSWATIKYRFKKNQSALYKTGDCLNENNLYTTTHQFLGYSPKPNNINTCTLTYKDSLIYDITYSIDKNGYRITPDKKDNDCVWIYGGSYTYGEGVNDKHSMPYVIGANHNTKIHNLGFSGYGPHQMLSHIQNNKMSCNPRYAIYQFIEDHVSRANGFASWDKKGPMYLFEDNKIKYKGMFEKRKEIFFTKNIKHHFYIDYCLRTKLK